MIQDVCYVNFDFIFPLLHLCQLEIVISISTSVNYFCKNLYLTCLSNLCFPDIDLNAHGCLWLSAFLVKYFTYVTCHDCKTRFYTFICNLSRKEIGRYITSER